MVVGYCTLDYNNRGPLHMDLALAHLHTFCGFHGLLSLVLAYSQFSQLSAFKSDHLNSPEPSEQSAAKPDTGIPNAHTKEYRGINGFEHETV